MLLVSWILIGFVAHVQSYRQEGCSLPVFGEFEQRSPLILSNQTSEFEFIIPVDGAINLRTNQIVSLVCSDPRNYLNLTNANVTFASCKEGDILKVIKKNVKFDDLQCAKTIRGTVLQTVKDCGGSGKIYKIGYPVSKKDFLTLIEVCYDKSAGNTLYSGHIIRGEEASKSKFRPQFSAQGVAPDVAVTLAYKRKVQKAKFNQLLKSAKLAEIYFSKNDSYLARGHLSPDADFIFANWQYTTYYYINAVPQWQAINNGNWKQIEKMVRILSKSKKDGLEVTTGTFGVLTLPDVNKELTEIFLSSNEKLPVPKYVWKIIYSKNEKKAVVLIHLNNPFVEKLRKTDTICTNICEKFGWDRASWTNYRKGYLFCCEYKEFAKVVASAPKITVTGILNGPTE